MILAVSTALPSPKEPPAGGARDSAGTRADGSSFPLADPDTVPAEDGGHLTHGATVPAGRGKRCGGEGRLNVPVLAHGSGDSVGMADWASGDALPGGPGRWTKPGGAVWAPGVACFGDRYLRFSTATRKGAEQKCVGRAVAKSARGPFRDAGGWVCPPHGRRAIDAKRHPHAEPAGGLTRLSGYGPTTTQTHDVLDQGSPRGAAITASQP